MPAVYQSIPRGQRPEFCRFRRIFKERLSLAFDGALRRERPKKDQGPTEGPVTRTPINDLRAAPFPA